MELDEDVLKMVRSQLDRDPPPSTTALYGRAVRINSDIYELSLRQFHAMYPLRVKRERARRDEPDAGGRGGPAEGGEADGAGEPVPDDAGRRHLFGEETAATGRSGGRPEARRDGEPDRDASGAARRDEEIRERLRGVFWRLARDVAEADTAERLVDLVDRMPERVEEVARIVSGGSAES